jgi:molybdate transport system substrate-binding protein
MTRVFRPALAVSVVLVAGLTGCSWSSTPPPASIRVFAAASLKKPFTEIGERFKTDNPGASIELVFARTSELVIKLLDGASADVLATADTKEMGRAAQAGLLARDWVNFASNTLVIAVAPGNPKNIATFADLGRPDLDVVVCAPAIPCGSATQKIEHQTGVQLTPVNQQSSRTDVLNKVTSRQADAGLVYATDAIEAGDTVTAVAFPEAAGAVNTYPVAALDESKNPNLAHKFVDLVTGEVGQKILAQDGFAKPDPPSGR